MKFSKDASPLFRVDTDIKMLTKDVSADSTSVIIEGHANVAVEDRSGDIIPTSAWKDASALENYSKNPIILFAHDHSRPIGSALEATPDSKGLYIKAEIFKEPDPAVFSMVVNGILKTFSVGFRCLEAEWDEATDIFIIKKLELFETSVVAVPCNQDSTFRVSKGMTGEDYMAFRKQFMTTEQSQLSALEQLALAYGFVK